MIDKLRDCWRVERPAGYSGTGWGGDWRRAECWQVTITETRHGIRSVFRVSGELIAQILPERYCLDTRTWLPVEAEQVPGVYVGGREFKALGLARDCARDLITLLAGKMHFENVRLHKST